MRVAILLPLGGPHHLPAPSKVSPGTLAHALPHCYWAPGTREQSRLVRLWLGNRILSRTALSHKNSKGFVRPRRLRGHWLQAWGAGRRLAGNGQWPWGMAEARDPAPASQCLQKPCWLPIHLSILSLKTPQPQVFPGCPAVKNLPANAGNMRSIPGLGRFSHVAGQLSPSTITTAPLNSNY